MNDLNNSTEARKAMAVESRCELAFGQALWYAWGRIDSGQYQGFPLDAFKFAQIVKTQQRLFETEKTHFNESIQGQWEKFVAAESS